MAIIKRTPRPGELVRGATAGDLAAFGPDGELVDSGLATEDVPEWPEGGNEGDVMTKGADGPVWAPPSGGLPDVSSADNNKALSVKNGAFSLNRLLLYEYEIKATVPITLDGHSVDMTVFFDYLFPTYTSPSAITESVLRGMIGADGFNIDHPITGSAPVIEVSGDHYIPIDIRIYNTSDHVVVDFAAIKESSGTVSVIINQSFNLSAATFAAIVSARNTIVS